MVVRTIYKIAMLCHGHTDKEYQDFVGRHFEFVPLKENEQNSYIIDTETQEKMAFSKDDWIVKDNLDTMKCSVVHEDELTRLGFKRSSVKKPKQG